MPYRYSPDSFSAVLAKVILSGGLIVFLFTVCLALLDDELASGHGGLVVAVISLLLSVAALLFLIVAKLIGAPVRDPRIKSR